MSDYDAMAEMAHMEYCADTIKAQRDELLEALKFYYEAECSNMGGAPDKIHLMGEARRGAYDLIAKCEQK